MSSNKISNLEKKLNQSKMETSKYLKVVKTMKAKEGSDRISNMSPILSKGKEDDQSLEKPQNEIIIPTEDHKEVIDVQPEEVKEKIRSEEKVIINKEQKQKMRAEDFKKKIQTKNKQKRSLNAYESLNQYKKRVQKDKNDSKSHEKSQKLIIYHQNQTFGMKKRENISKIDVNEDIIVEELKMNSEDEEDIEKTLPKHVIELNLSQGMPQIVSNSLKNTITSRRNLLVSGKPESVEETNSEEGRDIIRNSNLINGKNLKYKHFKVNME